MCRADFFVLKAAGDVRPEKVEQEFQATVVVPVGDFHLLIGELEQEQPVPGRDDGMTVASHRPVLANEIGILGIVIDNQPTGF